MCNLLEVPVFQKLVGCECRISTRLFHTSSGKLDVKSGSKVLAADSNKTEGRDDGSTPLFSLNRDRSFVPVGYHFIGAGEYGTWARAISLANESFALHHVEDCRRAAIPDTQATLQHRG